MICELRIKKDVEGSGHGLMKGNIPEFVWKNWGKPQKSSVRIVDLWAEILTRNFPNTNKEW
jgi:hypothetical protein